MSREGFIKDYRQELNSDIWLMPPIYHRIWQWIKYSVNHNEGKIPNRDGTFEIISAGQHATSYRLIAQSVGYYEGKKWKEPNVKTVKVVLDWLIKQNMISVRGNTNGTIITVVNWELYQSETSKGNTKRITRVTRGKHLVDTNKKNKKNKNIKENSPKSFSDDSFERKCVDYLINSIKEDMPNAKVPTTQDGLDKWCEYIEKMVRIDKQTEEDIYNTLVFARTDSFWKLNIRSTSKFREKFETLYLQSKNKKTPKATTSNKFNHFPQREYSTTDFSTMEQKLLRKGK